MPRNPHRAFRRAPGRRRRVPRRPHPPAWPVSTRLLASPSRSCRHQWPGILEVAILDRVRRPIGERAHWTGRIVRCIVRKYVGTDNEQVVTVPALSNKIATLFSPATGVFVIAPLPSKTDLN